jgi:hypothetical protein
MNINSEPLSKQMVHQLYLAINCPLAMIAMVGSIIFIGIGLLVTFLISSIIGEATVQGTGAWIAIAPFITIVAIVEMYLLTTLIVFLGELLVKKINTPNQIS